MRTLQRTLWAAALSTLFSGAALAQTTGTTTTGTTGTTTGTTGGSSGGSSSGGSGGTLANPGGNAAQAAQQALQTPGISAPSLSSSANPALSPSNSLNMYYNNPLYQGRAGATTGGGSGGSSSSNLPGGFGVPLYGTSGGGGASTGTAGRTGTAATGTAGRAGGGTTGGTSGFGGSTGTASSFGSGTTSGFGGSTGSGGNAGGFGGAGGRTGQTGQRGFGTGSNSGQNQQNAGLSSGRQIAYTATLKFAAPAVAPPQMQADLRSILDSSSGIADARGIALTAVEGGVVTIAGRAKDEDEARLVENMIRLTPGVRDVKNELKFPKP